MSEALEKSLAALERAGDPALREAARAALAEVLAMHARVLERVLALARAAEPALAERLARDPEVRPVLALHGLDPEGLETRLQAALDTVRPQLKAHGGDARLLGVERGRARLRLQGACDGCPSSAATLKGLIERALLAAAPELEGVEVA